MMMETSSTRPEGQKGHDMCFARTFGSAAVTYGETSEGILLAKAEGTTTTPVFVASRSYDGLHAAVRLAIMGDSDGLDQDRIAVSFTSAEAAVRQLRHDELYREFGLSVVEMCEDPDRDARFRWADRMNAAAEKLIELGYDDPRPAMGV